MIFLDITRGLNHIGRLGENEHRTLRFGESAEVLAMYPGAAVTVLHRRPGDPAAYPVAPGYVQIQNGVVCWTIQSGDLTQVGRGKCELIFTVGDVIAKSLIYDTMIDQALDGSGNPPEPWGSWIEEVVAAGEHAPQIINGVWWAWSTAQEAYINTGVNATGPKGPQGPAGQDGSDYVITSEDYDAIAAEVATRQAIQGKVDAAESAANEARNWADGKNMDGTPSPSHSENNSEHFAEKAEAARDAIEDMSVSAQTLTPGSQATVTKSVDPQTGAVELEFGIPAGQDGEVDVSALAPVIIADATPGAVCAFDDGADGRAMESIVVAVEPVQAGSGDPSPDNVRSISGWTGANISHSGEDTSDPDVYNVQFPSSAGTVYGGRLNPIEGTLTVDRAMYTVTTADNTALSQAMNDNVYRVGIQVPGFAVPTNTDDRLNLICNIGTPSANITGSNANVGDCLVYPWTNNDTVSPVFLIGVPATENPASKAKEWLVENGCVFVRRLAEPIVYNLDTITIRTLLGANRLWADTGNVLSARYSADTKGYVDGNEGVKDVQIGGTSAVVDGVVNIPVAGSNLGVVKIDGAHGLSMVGEQLSVYKADSSLAKGGSNQVRPIVPYNQHESAFYGLAKASGDTTQSASSNAVGNYTESAKSTISQMLNGSVAVSGTTPSITALPGIRYVCGEVATLDITLPASGIVDVVFESGSTATVLTITPPTGQTVKWANGFDPTALDANTTYEINIADGLGVAGSWT